MQRNFFHGTRLHKRYATINVRDINGKEIKFISKCKDFQQYINSLNENDSVVLEAINNAFYWADKIETQGASCVIVNPHKFKIIKESWNKTDKRDAANLSLGLWMSELRNEFKLPTVYKPAKEIRDLRKLFSLYQMVTEQQAQHKNSIQAIFVENGIALDSKETYKLFKPDGDITILVLAFLADVGDVKRFKNVRGFNAYLGGSANSKIQWRENTDGPYHQTIKKTCPYLIYSNN